MYLFMPEFIMTAAVPEQRLCDEAWTYITRANRLAEKHIPCVEPAICTLHGSRAFHIVAMLFMRMVKIMNDMTLIAIAANKAQGSFGRQGHNTGSMHGAAICA